MPSTVQAKHLKRYGDILRLFVKYGRSDLVRDAGIDGLPTDSLGKEPTPTARRGSEAGNGPMPEEDRKAEQLARDLESLGPTFIKAGQFLSTRADILPPTYLRALSRLQDDIEPFPFAEVEHIVTEELGSRISKAFAIFEDVPLAAASLGQVHRAELRDGRAVAVKVQRPAIRDRMLEDLEALEQVATFLDGHSEIGKKYGFEPMLEEFRKSLFRELDYRQEARHLSRLADNLEEFRRIFVPRPIEDYTTSRVLTMDFVSGRKVTAVSPLARMEVDGAELAEELCRAYLHQILVDGFFHADPHPGNVFLTEDGRLALIDLGMVAHLSASLQESLLKFLLAVSEGRGDEAAELALRLAEPAGDRTDRRITSEEEGREREREVRRKVTELVARFQDVELQDLQVGRVMLEVSRIAADAGLRLPRELTMLGKTLLNIDQVGRILDPSFDPNASIRRNAAEILRRRMMKTLTAGKLFAGALEMKEFAEALPGRLNTLFDALAQNRMRIRVDAIDEGLLMQGLQKIANRITLGVVVAALIIGAAMLMRIETRFRIFGYPGLAILLFMLAAACGLMLIANILVSDLRRRRS